jgi:hypothetical protein
VVGRKLPMRAGGAITDYLAGIAATADEARGAGEALGPIGDRLAEAVASLQGATDWLLANGLADPVNALAGATPYLRMCGLVTGGWLLARSAVAAQRRVDAGDTSALLEQKIVTARFYCDQLLPQAAGLVAAVTAGPADLVAATFQP